MHGFDPSRVLTDPFVASVAVDASREAITLAGVVALGVLILLSAFFASSEIAIFSLGDHRIGALVDDGVPGAGTLADLKSDPRRLLVTILVGNNVANIAMSSVATGVLGLHFGPTESVPVATFGITSVVLLFGESAPKSFAVEHSESWALRIARPLRVAQYVLYPLVELFDFLARLVNKLTGSEGNVEAAYVTRSEIRDMIEAGQREGVFSEDEHRMLQRLLRFRNRIAKETMVPRLDVVAVSADADLSTAVDVCIESGFTQLPVYEGTLDEVFGVVDVQDLLMASERGESRSLRDIATAPFVVPETKESTSC
jgi:CBS domain containing-hemolysin-like protein